MVPLQVIILALAVLTYSSFPQRGASPLSPAIILATVAGSHVVLVWMVWLRARRVERLLHQPGNDSHRLNLSMEKFLDLARWITVALAVCQIWGLGWGQLVVGKEGWRLDRMPLAAEIVLLLPGLLAWMGFWWAQYPVERAIRERALTYRLAMALPAHEMPSRGEYLAMQMRHGFFLLVPLLLGTLAERLADPLRGWLGYALAGLVLGKILLLTPWMVTRIWSTTPMTGDLRTRLVNLAREHRVGFRNVLIWRTYHHVNNAAILGYLPFARYFLMTDSLLESLTDRQIEAVFAHEVGHGRHRHLWWYIAAFAAAGALSLWAADWCVTLAERWSRQSWSADTQDMVASLAQLVLLGVFLTFGFSWISRRFEHQADWFAAQHMARSLEREPERAIYPLPLGATMTPDGSAAFPSDPPDAAARGGAACLRGVSLFMSALETLVQASHRSLKRGGWMHPSPRQRAALLWRLARSPQEAAKFERQMTLIRVGIVVLAALAVTLWVVVPSPEAMKSPQTQPLHATGEASSIRQAGT